tara:strand:+ start:169 stop:360 length:192 start_codon:yes stop_codon:yes gene_type:complete
MSSLEKQLEVLINLQTETLSSVKELARLLAAEKDIKRLKQDRLEAERKAHVAISQFLSQRKGE